MACLKQRGNFWYAVIRKVPNGAQSVHKTGVRVKPTDGMTPANAKKLAQAMADNMELAARGTSSVSAARDSMESFFKSRGLVHLPTVKELFDGFTSNASEKTQSNSRRARKLFLDFLGDNSSLRCDKLSADTCIEFFKLKLLEVSINTCKGYRDHLATVYNKAKKQGIVNYNPFNDVDMTRLQSIVNPELVGKDTHEREPFTDEELSIILYKFPAPYNDLAAVSAFLGGQRIGDCIRLKWESIDFEKKIVSFIPEKTKRNGRRLSWPLLAELEMRLLAIKEKSTDDVYVFPELVSLASRRNGGVSTAFTNLLISHGIIEAPVRAGLKGKRRVQASKTFHCIRHFSTSYYELNPAVSDAVSFAVVGHKSKRVHDGYVTVPSAEKVKAMEEMTNRLVKPSED